MLGWGAEARRLGDAAEVADGLLGDGYEGKGKEGGGRGEQARMMMVASAQDTPYLGCWLDVESGRAPGDGVWRLRPKPRVSAALRVGDYEVQFGRS